MPSTKATEFPFCFYKGSENVISKNDITPFEWNKSAATVREHLTTALNAKHVAFLLGSGCSSVMRNSEQVGIQTMKPMALGWINAIGKEGKAFPTHDEVAMLKSVFGLDVAQEKFAHNLERLMEVLYSLECALAHSTHNELKAGLNVIKSIITKINLYICKSCTEGPFSADDGTAYNLYQSFYRKLIFRDQALPRPWIFTTNYDLFNEVAMDRLGIPYCNGFSGSVERRFNPANFRYSLAEQLDISNKKWAAVDNFVYLCKLHGSVNWTEEQKGLFPIRETPAFADAPERVMIYPTPAKQNASFGFPYSDLFREFQARIVRDQSVLFVLGYSFSDEHINNIVFQALTIPGFRIVIFADPEAAGVIGQLKSLGDPRIWIIGGAGPGGESAAHYFDTFIDRFMPEPPGVKVDTAVAKILEHLIKKGSPHEQTGQSDDF